MASLSPKRIDEAKFQEMWDSLAASVGLVIQMQSCKAITIVEDVYSICTCQPQPLGENLYNNLKKFLEVQVEGVRETMMAIQGPILSAYLAQWQKYSVGSEYLHSLFRYLNSVWIKKRLDDSRNKLSGLYPTSGEVHEVFTLALLVWHQKVFSKCKERLLREIADIVQRDRDGEAVSSEQIGGVVQSFVRLGIINKTKPLEIYKEEFEAPFVKSTREFYERESANYIATHGVSSYMMKAEARIEEEEKRAKKFLDTSSYDKIKKEIDAVLVEKHKEVLQVECLTYLKEELLPDLTRMFHLMSRIEGGTKPMLQVLETYVSEFGIGVMKGLDKEKAQDPREYVEALLGVHLKFSGIVSRAFSNDPAFVASLDKACRKVVNENPLNKGSSDHSPQMLAKYCDALLKKGNKKEEGQQLEEKLNQVILLFKYVDEKDVFQRFYSKMLARRLIQGMSVSDESESFMIGGLKAACGYEYTSKLQRMFSDMQLSNEINDKFKDYRTTKSLDLGGVDFSVLVLTQGSWPLQAQAGSFTVPADMLKCLESFQAYYNTQHHGRKLNWLHHLSKGDVRTNKCWSRRYEISMTGHQMACLLPFNNQDAITMDELVRLTEFKEPELKRLMQSLVDAKLLVKAAPAAAAEGTASTSSAESFSVNPSFQNPRIKFKIPAPTQADGGDPETKATLEAVQEDRKLYLQAAIVRIMKMRKTLEHPNLVTEVISQARTRFVPDIPMIKKQIEHLIEKEYLKREGASYQYLA